MLAPPNPNFLNGAILAQEERRLFPVFFQRILQQTRDYANGLFNGNNAIEEVFPPEDEDLTETINAIIRELERIGKKHQFIQHFPDFRRQRKETIRALRKTAEELSEIRLTSNVGRVLSVASTSVGGIALAASFVCPPIAAITATGVAASALGGVISAGTEIRESMLTQQSLSEIQRVINKDRLLLANLGISDFVNEMNIYVQGLFQTSDNIFDTVARFLNGIPTNAGDIGFYMNGLRDCVAEILPRIGEFLRHNVYRFAVSLTSLFVFFVNRRRYCMQLDLFLQNAGDVRPAIANLLRNIGMLSPALISNLAIGAAKGIFIILDILLVVFNCVNLKQHDKAKIANEIANELQEQLNKYQSVYDELRRQMLVEQRIAQTQNDLIFLLLGLLVMYFLLNFPLLLILMVSIFFVYFLFKNM